MIQKIETGRKQEQQRKTGFGQGKLISPHLVPEKHLHQVKRFFFSLVALPTYIG
jgi:hypothetical protein